MFHHPADEYLGFPGLSFCRAEFCDRDLMRLRVIASLGLDGNPGVFDEKIVSRLVSSSSLNYVEWLLDPAESFLYQRLKVDALRRYQRINRLVNSDEPTEGYAKIVGKDLVFFARQGGGILLNK